MKKYRGPDSVRPEDLRDAQRFFENTKALRRRAGISARDLWEFRTHALRRGRVPLGLFVWMCHHPEEARRQVTNADEDHARQSWRDIDAKQPELVPGLAKAFTMKHATSAEARLARLRRMKSVRQSKLPDVRHRRARRRGPRVYDGHASATA